MYLFSLFYVFVFSILRFCLLVFCIPHFTFHVNCNDHVNIVIIPILNTFNDCVVVLCAAPLSQVKVCSFPPMDAPFNRGISSLLQPFSSLFPFLFHSLSSQSHNRLVHRLSGLSQQMFSTVAYIFLFSTITHLLHSRYELM